MDEARADIEDGKRPGMTDDDRKELHEANKRIQLLEQENEVLRRAAAGGSQPAQLSKSVDRATTPNRKLLASPVASLSVIFAVLDSWCLAVPLLTAVQASTPLHTRGTIPSRLKWGFLDS
ncbi:hypothetical protein [Mumia sp. Pv 4-285]|uniref:hypothetical protein n=1 Tax=Mumia qirimensis TaxID=3234852 RepID=UPI00351D395B